MELRPVCQQCTGCGACAASCPNSCIEVREDESGFWVAYVAEGKCVYCRKCERVCPQINPPKVAVEKTDAFLCYCKDKQKQQQSASGGTFTALAETILDDGGIVCGAAMTNGREIAHILVEDVSDLYKLKGSKYSQSKVWDLLPQIKEVLDQGRLLLFSGTPCQVSGLLRYLQRPYANLYTVDLVCHGVPSNGLFRKHIANLENRFGKKIAGYSFRGVKMKWTILFQDETKKCGYPFQDIYYSGFQSGRILNEACYSCLYAGRERIGDITLGDFWGAEDAFPADFSKDGCSAAIVSTEKGQWLFRRAEDRLKTVETDIATIARNNPPLNKAHARDKQRDRVYKGFATDPLYMQHSARLISPYAIRAKQALICFMPKGVKNFIKKVLELIR